MRSMLRNRYCRSVMAVLLTLAMTLGTVGIYGYEADAASKPTFQKKKLTLAEGKTAKLKVKKMPKGSQLLKTKWKVQKKSVLKLTLSGSKAKKKKAKTAKIKALKAGKSAVYCTLTYRVKKGGKWKTKKNKVKAAITVSYAGNTSTPQKPDAPSEPENPGANVSAAPGDTAKPDDPSKPGNTTKPGDTANPGETTDPSETSNPGETADPSETSNPGEATDPSETSNPGETTDPNETVNPGETTDPSETSNPGETTNPNETVNPGETTNPAESGNPNGTTKPDSSANPGEATSTPAATPTITPKPSPVTLTWTGKMVRAQWDNANQAEISGSYSQGSCSSGLKVASNAGCWYFDISCSNWSQYQYPVLKCYRLEGDNTAEGLELWYGSDDAGKVTYSFGDWNGKAISLDKAKISQTVKISNYTPIGKIEICEGEAPAKVEGDVGSQDFSKTALEFSKELKIGWNLGNTLESIMNSGAYVSGTSGLAAETSWGCPKATEGLIKAVKEAGFNTIRVPVSWTNHTDPNNGYKIDEAWMDRVEEVVQYCTSNGLYVILNVHHDGSAEDGHKSWLIPNPADEAAKTEMKNRYQKVWEQIATRFQDYSNLVLFASMNEFHRHNDYDAPASAYTSLQNELHQIFVNTVRATEGNNANRYLIIPGYNTNIDYTISGLKLPVDTVENHLMVEVHYYDPYTFATDGNETDQWGSKYGGATDVGDDSWAQEDYLVKQLKKMKTAFVDKGIPVVIGEFGAPAKKNPDNEKYRTYYLQYVVKYAVEYGFVPVYWDNGTSYKLFDRGTYAVVYPDIVNGMMAALESGYTIPLPQ